MKFVPKGPIYSIPALDNGFAPARQQAFIWANDG